MSLARASRRTLLTLVTLGLLGGAVAFQLRVAESQIQPVLDPFMCYELRRQPRFPGQMGVGLVNLFGASTANVRTRKRLCNPAVVVVPVRRGEPISIRDHLTVYELRQTDPGFTPIEDVEVTNDLGTIVVDLIRPDRLMVPTTKTRVGEEMRGNGVPHDVDHYECYRVRGGQTRVDDIEVTDQFGMLTADVKRPDRLCVPVDKRGEGIVNTIDNLMCYRVRTVPRRLLAGESFHIDNQFESETVVLTGPRELCMPSWIRLPDEPRPSPSPTPPAPEPCGQLRGAPPSCGGFCEGTDETCVFDGKGCRCADVSELCHPVPPQTSTEVGVCDGLCPRALESCVPIDGTCACLEPS